ncbi:hypothetical protein HYFRA_00002956 [Hymenoscyphus fraxineus]|uniref:Ubiquitin-like protease family profile domain-containing protein n=1 Tax=Hymenoscyphus fraxineus TaxID=746836 RepID=A0A9N9KRE0_9HELO|nr:hypothetical protein HYFRA_00002956 [Hymenoscyphus fraxineus]
MSYDDICNRADWSMDDSEFAEFIEGGYFLWDNTLRDIIAALEPNPGSHERQAMDCTFLNHFEMLLTAASPEAAVEFAQSSPMGKCQDVNVDWIMPYCFDGVHWVTVIISRQDHYWGVYDSLHGCEYAGLFAAVEFLVKSLHVEGEPEKEWQFGLLPTIQQDDGWSCGIHTVEHVLHFLRDGGSHLGDVDVMARRQEYFDALLELEHPQAVEYSEAEGEEGEEDEEDEDVPCVVVSDQREELDASSPVLRSDPVPVTFDEMFPGPDTPPDSPTEDGEDEEVPCVVVSDQREELDASSPVLRSSPVPVTFGEMFPGPDTPPDSPTEDGESEKVPSIAISPCEGASTPSPLLLPDPALGDFDPPTLHHLTHSSTFPESIPPSEDFLPPRPGTSNPFSSTFRDDIESFLIPRPAAPTPFLDLFDGVEESGDGPSCPGSSVDFCVAVREDDGEEGGEGLVVPAPQPSNYEEEGSQDLEQPRPSTRRWLEPPFWPFWRSLER